MPVNTIINCLNYILSNKDKLIGEEILIFHILKMGSELISMNFFLYCHISDFYFPGTLICNSY